MRRVLRRGALGILLLLGCCSAEQAVGEATVQKFGGPTMGSSYEVKFVGAVDAAAVRAVVEDELAAFDRTFSKWRPDSELAHVNAHASGEPLPVSARFAAVLRQALDVAAATDGAFDPTVAPLCDLYRAARRDPQHRLDPRELETARQRVDYRRVQLRDVELRKQRPDVQLDLDALAAGAACDAVAARLEALGVRSFYVQITGEVLCRGEKRRGEPWVVGIADPRADLDGRDVAIRTVSLRDRALCTSGTYRNAFVANGVLVHHVFDPRTGASAQRDVVSVSVLANSTAIADAFATAFVVLGADDARRLWPAAQRLGVGGALFLLAGEAHDLRPLEICWPPDAR